jgi:hypothetical protein
MGGGRKPIRARKRNFAPADVVITCWVMAAIWGAPEKQTPKSPRDQATLSESSAIQALKSSAP